MQNSAVHLSKIRSRCKNPSSKTNCRPIFNKLVHPLPKVFYFYFALNAKCFPNVYKSTINLWWAALPSLCQLTSVLRANLLWTKVLEARSRFTSRTLHFPAWDFPRPHVHLSMCTTCDIVILYAYIRITCEAETALWGETKWVSWVEQHCCPITSVLRIRI